MRVCPKCGFRDPLEWRNLRFRLYAEYMTFLDFKQLYPELAPQLEKNPKIVCDAHHCYHLTKSGHVHRVPKYLCVNGKFYHASGTMEKPKDPFQQKLERKEVKH